MSLLLADTVLLLYPGICERHIKLMNGFDKTGKKPFPCVGNSQLNFGPLESEKAEAGVTLAHAPRHASNQERRVVTARSPQQYVCRSGGLPDG